MNNLNQIEKNNNTPIALNDNKKKTSNDENQINKISKNQIKNMSQAKPILSSLKEKNLVSNAIMEKVSSFQALIDLSTKKRDPFEI